jgi:hypothetical protein
VEQKVLTCLCGVVFFVNEFMHLFFGTTQYLGFLWSPIYDFSMVTFDLELVNLI